MNQPQRIIILDDEEDVGELIAMAAEGLGLPCLATCTVSDFFGAFDQDTTLIFLDLLMPETDGIEVLRFLSERPHKPAIVLMSGIGKRVMETADRLAESLGLTVVAQLQKPFRLTEVEDILRRQSPAPKAAVIGSNTLLELPEDEIKRAVAHNEFALHYQPQLEMTRNRVVGAEALVRWQHPERGLLFPGNFIPEIERLGLNDALGWIVAERTAADYQTICAAAGHEISISINVAVDSLRDLTFPDRLVGLLQQFGMPPERLVIEITESGLINELCSALDVLTRLRMKGVHLSVDDFGTGYSMMQQLRLVPANEIKIDRSFLQGIHGTGSDRVMVLKTIEIAHELDMYVVAEGVETSEQLAFLREHGCDVAQGYLFSRPLPLDKLQEWLASHRETNCTTPR